MKKIVSLICCLLPVGAGAVVVNPESGQQSVSTTDSAWQSAVGAGSTITIDSGNGLLATGRGVSGDADYVAPGFSVAGNMYVGVPSDQGSISGDLYVLNTTADPFTVISTGDVSIGSILQVLGGKTLAFQSTDSLNAFNLTVGNNQVNEGIKVGDNTQSASLVLENIDVLTVNGSVITYGDMTVDANLALMGQVNVNAGDFSVVANAVEMDGLVSGTDKKTDVVANEYIAVAGTVQNNAGDMTLTVGAMGGRTATQPNGIDISGSLENKSAGNMGVVTNADLMVWGIVSNEDSASSMIINVNNFTVNGGVDGYSLVNNGVFRGNVAGVTYLANGWNLNNGNLDADFYLETGSLEIADDTAWQSAFANNLNDFQLYVRDDVLDLGQYNAGIINGAQGNTGANMVVAAQSIDVNSIENNGASLSVLAGTDAVNPNSGAGDYGNLTVNDFVSSAIGSSTNLIASGVLGVSGDVTNQGQMLLKGNKVDIEGNVINTKGNMKIVAGQEGVNLGALFVNGGVVSLDSQDTQDTQVQFAGGLNVGQNGALNFSKNIESVFVEDARVYIEGDVTVGNVGINNGGNVNIAATGFQLSADLVTVAGGVSIGDLNADRSIILEADESIVIGDGVSVSGGNSLSLLAGKGQDDGLIDVGGTFNVQSGGDVVLDASEVAVGSLNVADGGRLQVGGNFLSSVGDINIAGALNFSADNGLYITGTGPYTIQTTGTDADIRVGSVLIAENKDLTLNSADDFVVAGGVDNSGSMNVTAGGNLQIAGALNNKGTVGYLTINGDMTFADIDNEGDLNLYSAKDITAADIVHSDGVMDVVAQTLKAHSLVAQGQVNIVADKVEFAGDVSVGGDLVHGTEEGVLNLDVANFAAGNLFVDGDFIVDSGNATYDINGVLDVNGNIEVSNGAYVGVGANHGVKFSDVDVDFGTLKIDSGAGVLELGDLTMDFGNLLLDGAGMTMTGAIDTSASLYQGYNGVLEDGDINVLAKDYEITTSAINLSQINQSGKLVINTSDVSVSGDINATDLRFVAQLGDGWTDDNPDLQWLNVNVDGDVSGGVQFVGLKQMDIEGNYEFDLKSALNAAVLQYSSTGSFGTTDRNYWATVDSSYIITNAKNGEALISVGGVFSGDAQYDYALKLGESGDGLAKGQIGINLFDVVDQGTAIWLLHADGGVEDFASLERLNVRFCNADGSLCYNYLDSVYEKNGVDINGDDDFQPAYLTVRDTDGDGLEDSLYVVFGIDFMGPLLLDDINIQRIVAREPNSTNGEYVAAGALDDLLISQARNKGFFNAVLLESVPDLFVGTNMQDMANELYNRMLYYFKLVDGKPLMNFSRLFQVREIDLLSGALALNEHTSFRSFEDRMFDEFIWNRNRQLKKAWLDVDYGMFYQDIDDAKHTDGNRFSISGGFDWQETDTLVLGLTGRVSHSTASANDAMDLGYLPGESIAGRVALDVVDTNVGFGGYLMKTLGDKARLYGNAFLDVHMFDVERSQNYVDTIDGDGVAFSLISEWGLMHDLLNQYIVGNAYARIGYNFGFDIQERVQGEDYMRIKSDGYFILTPGYSLTAQKRIYPSAWLQIRPYASVGVEYDVLGAPDFAKYKFAPAEKYIEYNINIDPLWLNIGGGVEVLSAYGVQMGLDYRYQYNNDIQLHNIRVSGSYRF